MNGSSGSRRRAIFLAVAVAAPALGLERAAGQETPAVPLPQTPGHHHLFYSTQLNDQPIKIAYAVYLPKDYATKPTPRPMVVFLVGACETGNNHAAIYVHGPAAEVKRHQDLADSADFIIFTPQCPPGMRWESPGLAPLVVEMLEFVKRSWRVDADRVCLTGLSMGGLGTWIVALTAPKGTFAAIAPICGNAFEPDRAAQHLVGTTVWIIVADNDGGYTEGSRLMFKTLATRGVDAILTEVPRLGHGVWGVYYPRREFYDFLLRHRRGQPPPRDRPFPEQLRAIGLGQSAVVDHHIADQFHRFLAGWVLLNCGPEEAPGLRAELNGRKGVFVTHPLNRETPCILTRAWLVPKTGRPRLRLVVGHHPLGEWTLVVRADGKDLFERVVGSDSARNGWLEVGVDLAPLAGQAVRLELVNAAAEKPHAAAYWAEVKLESH